MSRSPSSRSQGPRPLGELLSRFLERKGLAAKIEAASVIPHWAELVGPQIAAVTQALRVSDGTLFVAVESSAWIMELNLMKSEILRQLNAGKRAGRINGIVFVMGDGNAREEGRGKRDE